MRLAIYTCNIGRADEVHRPLVISQGADYVCLTDVPESVPWPWQPRCLNWGLISQDPVRASRYYKCQPWLVFPDFGPADVSIWQDTTHVGTTDYHDLVSAVSGDLAAYPHFARSCIYDEANMVALYGLDDERAVALQVEHLLTEGYPTNNGLHDASFLLRRHSNAVKAHGEIWWAAIRTGSRRDQLSFDYAIWKTGLTCHTLWPGQPGGGWTRYPNVAGQVSANPIFAIRPRGQRYQPLRPFH